MGDESLSIEETNKLREKLGLKPLKVDDAKEEQKKTAEDNYQEHKERLKKEREAKEIQARIEKAKTRRSLQSKLAGKSIAEEEDDEEDAAAWVRKQKALAEKRAKQEEEMDKSVAKPAAEYKSDQLEGLAIGHDLDGLEYGEQKIFTLKDSTILENEEEGDELENIQLVEKNKLEKNLENKRKKTVYSGVDDDEFGPDGPRKKSILSHYDEPEDRKRIFIGEQGMISAPSKSEEEGSQERKPLSLDINKMQEIRDYYTEQEMVQFRKPKTQKKKKVRSRVSNILEELSATASSEDHGSRRGRDKSKRSNEEETLEIQDPSALMDKMEEDEEPEEAKYVPSQENFVDDDDLQEALRRARKVSLKNKTKQASAEQAIAEAAREARRREEEQEKEQRTGPGLVITTTTEFVRELEETKAPTHGRASARPQEEEDEPMSEPERERSPSIPPEDRSRSASPMGRRRAGSSREGSAEPASVILEEEPVVSKGLASALALFKKKGLIDEVDKEKQEFEKKALQHDGWKREQLLREMEQEKAERAERERDRDRSKTKKDRDDRDRDRSDRDRDREREVAKKFENYQPVINLEYIDKFGRPMDPKEAFRVLSHKFHGKPPGKKKTEKELRKVEMEMKQRSSVDHAMKSLNAVEERQKKLGQAGVVIQIGNKQVLPPSVSISDKPNEPKKRKGEGKEGEAKKAKH